MELVAVEEHHIAAEVGHRLVAAVHKLVATVHRLVAAEVDHKLVVDSQAIVGRQFMS